MRFMLLMVRSFVLQFLFIFCLSYQYSFADDNDTNKTVEKVEQLENIDDDRIIIRNKFYKSNKQQYIAPIVAPVQAPVNDNTIPSIYKRNQRNIKEPTIFPVKKQTPVVQQTQKKETSVWDGLSKAIDDFLVIPQDRKLLNSYIQGSFGFNLGIPTGYSGSFKEIDAINGASRRNFNTDIEHKIILKYDFALGYNFTDYVRAEVGYLGYHLSGASSTVSKPITSTISGQTRTIDTTGDLGALANIHTINFNILFDTNRRKRVYFSFGGGIGTAFMDFKSSNIKSAPTLAFNGVAQLNIRLSDHIVTYIEYRYQHIMGREYNLINPISYVNSTTAFDDRQLRSNTFSMSNLDMHTFSAGLRIYIW